MKRYVCPCGYVYDPEIGDPDNGIAPGTPWEEVPDSWVCPVCSIGKEGFAEEQKKMQLTPTPAKAVFVSRVKFPVSLTKASQGDSLAAFLASIQGILYSYETAKHFKMKF